MPGRLTGMAGSLGGRKAGAFRDGPNWRAGLFGRGAHLNNPSPFKPPPTYSPNVLDGTAGPGRSCGREERCRPGTEPPRIRPRSADEGQRWRGAEAGKVGSACPPPPTGIFKKTRGSGTPKKIGVQKKSVNPPPPEAGSALSPPSSDSRGWGDQSSPSQSDSGMIPGLLVTTGK